MAGSRCRILRLTASSVFTPPLAWHRRLRKAGDWFCPFHRYALNYSFSCVDNALWRCLSFKALTATRHSQLPDTIPPHVLSPDLRLNRCPASMCLCFLIVQFYFFSSLLRVSLTMLSEPVGTLIESRHSSRGLPRELCQSFSRSHAFKL